MTAPNIAERGRLSTARWTALCAAAEAIGLTAAAAAAKGSQALVGEPSTGRGAATTLSLVVAGGLVEGVALGGLQAAGLSRLVAGLDRRRWLLVTTAVAGVGWAAASAPSALSGPGDGLGPPLLPVLGGAAGLGVVMGLLLGAAQATVLRGRVGHPWRWVLASATAWAPAMVLIFLGATAPGADWPVLAVVALGTLTGAAAGTVLGLVSGWFLPGLDGPPAHDRAVVALLRSPAHRALDGSLAVLRLHGVVTGRQIQLPVQYAVGAGDSLVVAPGRPETKRWWRNLRRPQPVQVLLRGTWRSGRGRVVHPGDPGYPAAADAYRDRWPRAALSPDAPLVRLRLGPTTPAGQKKIERRDMSSR